MKKRTPDFIYGDEKDFVGNGRHPMGSATDPTGVVMGVFECFGPNDKRLLEVVLLRCYASENFNSNANRQG